MQVDSVRSLAKIVGSPKSIECFKAATNLQEFVAEYMTEKIVNSLNDGLMPKVKQLKPGHWLKDRMFQAACDGNREQLEQACKLADSPLMKLYYGTKHLFFDS